MIYQVDFYYEKDVNCLNSFYNFYKTYPEILQSLTAKSILSWTHYTVLMQVTDPVAREWYEKEALGETWSVRTLQRNIDSQYYYRMLSSQVKEPVKQEMESLTEKYQKDRLEFIKNPMVVEFLGLKSDTSFTESKLESSIIARYSILRGNEQLFASKYKLYLPNEELLRAEIESQKAIF